MTPANLFCIHSDRFIVIRTFEGGCARYGYSNTSLGEAILDSRVIGVDVLDNASSSLECWERTEETRVHRDMKFQVYRRM